MKGLFRFCKKLTVVLLTFSLLFPLGPAFAQEVSSTPVADTAPADSVVTPPEAITPPAAVIPDTTTNPITTPDTTAPDQTTVTPSIFEPTIEQPTTPETSPVGDATLTPSNQTTTEPAPTDESSAAKKPTGGVTTNGLSYGGITYKYPDPTQATKLPKIQNYNGALTYDYPIAVPPGRNGLQPNLVLSYNSSDSNQLDNQFGAGWSLNIPYIQRANRRGVNKLYSTTTPVTFFSSVDGELATTTATSTYVSRTDNGSFNSYAFSDNQWLMTDKNGTQYKFGYATSTQMYNASSTSQIYKWMLEEVQDTNGNYIRYSYYKNGGQLYPSAVTYTGTSTADGIFEVDFLRESRSDIATSTAPGFTVVTNSRINEIDVKVNGTWVRKYVFGYTTGGNGYKSLLNSITESGQDELSNITTLPAETFSYQSNTPGWATTTTWHYPFPIVRENGAMNFAPFLNELDGDALADAGTLTGGPAYLNNGSNWATTTPGFNFDPLTGDGNRDYGVRMADINGDGLPDVMRGWRYFDYLANLVTGEWVNLNTGSSFASTSPTWHLPANFAFYDEWGQEMNAAVADVNGDGLADLLSDVVYLNNGVNGWATTTPSWTVPVGFTNYNATLSPNIYLGDVNGDGLTDIVVLGSGGGTLYKNTGSSWTIDNSWTIPGMAPDSLNDWGVRMIDLNGDGLPDFFRSWQEYQGSPPTVVDREAFWLNTGSGWASDSNWHMPGGALMVDPNLNPYGLQIGDFNGDALPDLLRSWSQYDTGGGCCEYKNAEWVNNGSRTDLLTTVTYPQGGNTTVTYKPSAKYMSGSTILNPHLPMALDVVYQTTSTDGNGSSFTDTYTYKNGAFYYNNAFDRQLAGFAEVDKSDGAGNVTKTFYHTGGGTDSSHGEYSDNFFKIGKSYRVEKYDNSGNLYEKIINKWDHSAISDSAAGFVKLAQTVNSIYDGDTSHKDKAESYTYNSSTGDVTQKVEWGEVTGSDDGTFSDTGSDKFTTDYGYATSSTSSIMSLLNHIIVTDQNSTKVKETKYYFDNLSFGTVDKGNQTKEEDWKSGSDYINTQKTYNGYGLVITSTDPRGKQTTYTYDAYKLYPVTVTNPVSQVMQYVYDYSSGKVATSTDANGNMFVAKYDGLDRLTEQKQPDPSATSTLLTKLSVTYTDTSGSVSVQKSENLDGSTVADIYVYYDGLGRQIQERKEAEGSNFATRDFSYNNIGLMNKESLPYFSSGSNKTTATTTAALFTAYTFDALLRPKTEANAVGTTTVSHLDWKVTVTDPRGKTKDLYNDAFDNLIQVDEHNSTSTYTTLYSYNYLGNLTSITDALSNVRNFTYDGLGRRLTAQDLHSSGDGAYGSYTYTYDDAGNLTQKVDPKSQTINYTYDDINRQLTEDYTGSGGTEVTYTFDTCTQGKGRLCSASSSAVSILNAYNALGQLTNSTSTINSTAYPSSYMYDRLGNLLTITNPDGSQVKYTYNSAGQLETVQRKESTDGGYSNLVTNFDYSPTEQVATIAYANGASITNTYDPAQIYRLSNKSTTSGTSTVQSLAYLYDADGNITKITDNSNTHSAKVVDYGYDDLNRLTSASSSLASFGGNYLQTYAYDALGNITSKSDLGSYTYSGAGYTNPDAVTSIRSTNYSYDNNGNMTAAGNRILSWNYNNRLTQVVIPGSPTTTVTSAYDPSGQRVKYTVASTSSVSTYFPTKSYRTDGITPTKHIFAGSMLVATVTGTVASSTVYSVIVDHLSGSNVILNASGGVVELTDYYPYGSSRLDERTGSVNEKRKFTGQEFDSDTGLYYMNARYQNPTTGRFISQDPAFINLTHLNVQLADPQSWNSYAYARNNPIVFMDPYGNMWTPWQSSGGFTNWMGNGGLLYNVYGSNVNSITATAQNIQQNGWTSDNIMALGADAASVTAKTSGVIVGSAGLGMGAGVAVESGAVSTVFNSQAAIRGGINATINVGSQALSDKVEGKQTSLGDYAKIAGISYLSGALVDTKSIKINALASAGSNALSQAMTGDHTINPVKVGAAGLGGGFSGWAGNYLSTSGNLGFYTAQQYGLGRIGWSVETPISIINSGVSKKK